MKTKRSRISGSGIARVHLNSLEKLGIPSGSVVSVAYRDKTVKLVVFGDTLIGEEDIRLREKDINKLGVKKGDYVSVICMDKKKKNVKEKMLGILKHLHLRSPNE